MKMDSKNKTQNAVGSTLTSRQIEQYVDYSSVSEKAKMVWKMRTGELIKNKLYRDAINSYRDALEDETAVRGFDNVSFEVIEYHIYTNMGGGLPIKGFFEMKEKIFEIADRD